MPIKKLESLKGGFVAKITSYKQEFMSLVTTSKAGSLPGAILLITGCCIGAGMLGLPVMSAIAGFKPSLAMFLLSWLFMTTTALLLLEVNLWFPNEVSIITMAGKTLGVLGRAAGWACFAFLFYALGIAYISASGDLIASFLKQSLHVDAPNWLGSVAVSFLFGAFVYLGTYAVDHFNRLLMGGLVLTYLLLVILGAPHVDSSYLRHQDWTLATVMLPVMIICFGFHNLIPSLTTYLQRDVKRLRLAVICGSAIPLVIYLIWEWLILGIVPFNSKEGFLEVIDEGSMATELLKNAVGTSLVVYIAQYFALFAILTSFLGNSLSFVDFLADGLKIEKTPTGKLGLCFLVIAPSLTLALIYPHLFLSALNYAGVFGAVILFGILPTLMVWSGRYRQNIGSIRIVPGGKAVLALILIFALMVMAMQFVELP
jgi:tyrosine-specific transport protein